MLTGRMHSATTRHATCTGLGLTSQATCPARILWWRMRRWMTELLKACGCATTSAPPCSGCTRSSYEKWYVSAIPVISTTFFLSYVRRISLTALTSLPLTSARCTRRMATRCNACRFVRARAFALLTPGMHYADVAGFANTAGLMRRDCEDGAHALNTCTDLMRCR